MSSHNTSNGRESALGESTPLLASAIQDPVNLINEGVVIENGTTKPSNANGVAEISGDTPLPMGQVAVLMIARLVDPVAFFGVFPFLPKMVELTGVRPEDVGFYAGIIESLFSVTQMFTMFLWGRAADRYGRKPVLVISLLGVAVFSTLFGLARSLWEMILLRCLAGVFSGSVVAMRAMFQEISTPKTTARSFSYFAFAGNLGIFLGPAIGSLARPAEQYPGAFGHIQFFHDWPYILPTAIIGIIGLIGSATSIIFLKETLSPEILKQKSGPQMSTMELIKSPGVPTSLLAFGYASMLAFGFTAVCPVYMYTPIKLGGFGFTERYISLFVSINGIAQALWLLLIFPPLHRKIGTTNLLRGCGIFWPLFLLSFPLDNYFLRQGWVAAFWTIAPSLTIFGSGVAMAFTGVQLALNEAAPSPEVLGTLTGIALTLSSAIRTVTPALFNSIYAFGVDKNILGGQLGMILLVVLAAGFYSVSSALTSTKIVTHAQDEEEPNSNTIPNEELGDEQ